MTDLKVEVDPGEVGFDATRLDRIEGHFQDYVDDGRLAGWLVTVARDGKLVYVADYGRRDIETGLPVEHDTIWRIYSMTKPITSLAAMMLWEQGRFDLNDPVEEYIPSFRNGRVYTGGATKDIETTPVHQPVHIWNLLSHTSGLSYGHPCRRTIAGPSPSSSTWSVTLLTSVRSIPFRTLVKDVGVRRKEPGGGLKLPVALICKSRLTDKLLPSLPTSSNRLASRIAAPVLSDLWIGIG